MPFLYLSYRNRFNEANHFSLLNKHIQIQTQIKSQRKKPVLPCFHPKIFYSSIDWFIPRVTCIHLHISKNPWVLVVQLENQIIVDKYFKHILIKGDKFEVFSSLVFGNKKYKEDNMFQFAHTGLFLVKKKLNQFRF